MSQFCEQRRTRVPFGSIVTYFLLASFYKTIQSDSLSNVLTFLDCFSKSSWAPLWSLCTRAPGLPYIEVLVCWSRAKHESSQLYLFSVTVTFAFWASTGDLLCKQLPVELKSQRSAVGDINSSLSLGWTQRVTYLTHLPPSFKNCKHMMNRCAKTVETNFGSTASAKISFHFFFLTKNVALAGFLPGRSVPHRV